MTPPDRVAPLALPATRREFLTHTASAVALLACGPRPSIASVTPAERMDFTLFVGTYTKSGASRGIYRTTVDAESLAFGALQLAIETPEPSFLALSPNGRTLVAVNELLDFEGAASGSVSAFAHDGANHSLRSGGRAQRSHGGAPCYVTIDRTGRFALVANYVGGNLSVHPLADSGAVGAATQVVAHAGTGPHATRQSAPHAHCIVLDAANNFAVAADLGADRLFVYRFDATQGRLTPAAVPAVALRAGAGPRHLAFAPSGRTLYCVNELDSTLMAFGYDASTGALTLQHTVSTRPAGATGDNAPADLHVHPNGHTVYLSNRGDNTIAVFSVHARTGALTLVQTVSSGGNWPRNFTLTPDGRGLLVAHQRSDSIVAFRVDEQTGRVTPTTQVLTAPVPVCLLFA